MRDVYTAKLSRLSDEILEMGNLCGQAIMKTCQLLASVEVREAATKEIGRIEKEIDDKEHNIEALCMQLLLKQQPVGTDLRKISAALKMVTDMERIGDQATDIAEILNTGSVHVPVTAIPLQEMADYAMHMVNDSVTAYVEGKSDLAKKVISSDDILDNLFDKVRNALDQYFWSLYGEDNKSDEALNETYNQTIADSNIKDAVPYINKDGVLCVSAKIYSIAGANYYYHMVEVQELEDSCTFSGESAEYDSNANVDYSANEIQTSDDYILPNSDSEYISDSDLDGLTADECRLALNEIYARHGRKFNDPDYRSYFNSKSWYNGTIDPDDFDDTALFNKYEIANRDYIIDYEKRMGYK